MTEKLTKEQELIRRFMAIGEDVAGLNPRQQEEFARKCVERMEKELGIKLRDV